MIIWERERQCESCYHECGYDEPVGVDEDRVEYDHIFMCALKNDCEIDMSCKDFKEDI